MFLLYIANLRYLRFVCLRLVQELLCAYKYPCLCRADKLSETERVDGIVSSHSGWTKAAMWAMTIYSAQWI